ncbi:MAG: YMGG-like glycine zipper-containing protein [Pseudomonadota bacterium]
MRSTCFAISVLLIVSLSACSSYRAGGVLRGATVGAGLGAFTGAIVGRPGRGAAVGAAIGAFLGGAEPRRYYRDWRHRGYYR